MMQPAMEKTATEARQSGPHSEAAVPVIVSASIAETLTILQVTIE